MAPIPLRGAPAFLLCAYLAAPAFAQDVVAPGAAGNVPAGQGQAGAIGGTASGSGGGVSAVPALGLGLSPTLGAAAAPAPAAQPAAGLHPDIQAALNIHAVDLNPPAGYYGHNPGKPVVWPLLDEPSSWSDKAKSPKKPAKPKPQYAPPAIDGPSHSAPSAGEIDAKLVLRVKEAVESGAAASEDSLNELYDGSEKKTETVDEKMVASELDPFYAPASHAAGLTPASEAPAKQPFALEPPAPKATGAKSWISNAFGALVEFFSPNGAGNSNYVPGSGTPTLSVLPQKMPDGGGERVLVRSSRGTKHEALGYRMLYAQPIAQGLEATSSPDETIDVRLERGSADESTKLLRARFAIFNGLIESNFAALELMAQSSSKMTVKTARAMSAHVAAMVEAYVKLCVGSDLEKESGPLKAEFGHLVSMLQGALDGLPDSDLLTPEAIALVMPIDSYSLHQYINYLHQQALEIIGKSDSASPANLTVSMGAGKSEKSLSLVDLSENPIIKGKRVVSAGFKALLAAMLRSKDTPKGSLIMQDHQFWGHFKLGAHSAEIYASFLQPDEGGMIRVRYQEWGTGYDNQTRLYYVGRLLHKAGFHVEQKNGFLTAVIDKDHASQTADEMTDTFAFIVQALHATVGVDFALPMLVKGAKTSEEVGRRIDDWVDTVWAEGTLPFYVHNDQDAMVEGWREYNAGKRSRAILRSALDANLTRLGLPPIPAVERIGQRTIDRFVNEPIEAALARGQLLLGLDGRPLRNKAYDPLASLARAFGGAARGGARMAEVVSSLDPALFKYEPIGLLGALTVERAQRRLDPNGWVTVYALRDPKNGQIGLARAELSMLQPGENPRELAPAALFGALRAQGHPVAEFTPSETPPGTGYFEKLLREEPPARAGLGRRFQGMAASPGHGRTVLARATYDRAKAAAGGYIFVSPYTTPDDLDAIRGSKAVITTSGGLLSHAAITTREMGIPAAILSGVEWKDGAASLSSFDLGEPVRAGELTARPAKAAAAVFLREGEVVRLDPATGVVELFPPGASPALLAAAGALESFDASGDVEALSSALRRWIKTPASKREQKEIFAREMLSGLFSLAQDKPGASAALLRALTELSQNELGPLAGDAINGLAAAELKAASAEIRERRDIIGESLSSESVERLRRDSELRAGGLRELARKLGRPQTELAAYEAALAALKSEAKERHEALLAAEMSELQRHARLFPAATVSALPRIKSAIAKARRRGMDAGMIGKWEEQARRLEQSRRADMESRAPAVIPLSAILDVDVPWTGGKGAKLGEIADVVRAAGAEVPPGLALTIHAYRRFLRETGIAERLEALGADKTLTHEQRSERARRLILGAELRADSGVGREIMQGLAAQRLAGTPLAVRSSAVDEDGAEAAFAGAGDTHLYVDPAELLEHVKDVWASLWNPRALLYRETRGLSTANLAQAVVVQAMVDAEVSGVAFTQDPVSGSSGRVIVNAAFGLGEGIVSGRVAPDQYVLSKITGHEMLPPMISDKKLAIVRGKDGKGTVEQKMPPEWRRWRSMSPAKLKRLSDVAVALENHFGYALDIEFAFVGNKLYILQARPVTNNGAAAPAPVPAVPAGSKVKPAAAAPKARRVMFVCTGNTCRSPMAEYLAREKIARLGRPDIVVISRGLAVERASQGMNAQAKAALEGLGVVAEGHQAAQLTTLDVAGSALILTMTAGQAQTIRERFPDSKTKVYSLAEYTKRGGDIDSPYGGSDDVYRAAAQEIADAVGAFAGMIKPGAQGKP